MHLRPRQITPINPQGMHTMPGCGKGWRQELELAGKVLMDEKNVYGSDYKTKKGRGKPALG